MLYSFPSGQKKLSNLNMKGTLLRGRNKEYCVTRSLHDLVTRTFATVEAKDRDPMMRFFAYDAVLVDPHFPASQMQGKPAITEELPGSDGWNQIRSAC